MGLKEGSMGSILDHRYRLLGIVGEGGASIVHRAIDLESGELRAVKILERSDDRCAIVPRFRREARALLDLRHPHILPLHGVRFGEPPYLVTELCGGDSLRHRLRRSGPLPLHEVVAVGISTLDALHFAHRRGVVHRDVKPGNLLVRSDGSTVLADFGIALLRAERTQGTEGLAMGTIAFMAPEQRLDASTVDVRADIYAMGATLYELATGRTSADLFMAGEGSPRWEGLPLPFVRILRRACHYDPARRYSTARDMGRELRGLRVHGLDARRTVLRVVGDA